MPKGKPERGLDEQQLEGGGAGAGMSSVKQFEKSTPMADRALAKIDKVNAKRKQPNLFEMTDKERAALTPSQKRRYGSDMLYARPGVDNMDYKKGGLTASSRADGCAVKGKTKGRMV
jgi:hypothetical protein